MNKCQKTTSRFVMPKTTLGTVLEFVRRYGAQNVETGLFLLSRPDELELSIVALTGTVGIGRSPFQFRITGTALNRLFDWASDSSFQIRVQIHSHKGAAFLSPTDLEFGLSVEGFTTAVVPRYIRPPSVPARWGWWEFEDGDWRAAPSPQVEDRASRVITFDEQGVYE